MGNASEHAAAVLAPPILAKPKPDNDSVPSSHPLLKLQQSIGNRATGRLIQAKAAAANNAPERVPTDWYVDFWGVSATAGRKGRGNRDTTDVLILDDLTVGPQDSAKTFKKTGDALRAGYSHVGTVDHPKGAGSAEGVVSYAARKDLDVKLTWTEQKKGQTNLAASQAAKSKVEELILGNSDLSGDWTSVEKIAADAAAEHLPEGSDPKVEIQWRGSHKQYPLKTVSYRVDGPSLCTAQIGVPTTTTTGTWSRTDSADFGKKEEQKQSEQTRVEAKADATQAHSDEQASKSVGVKTDTKSDTSASQTSSKSHTERQYGVTWDDIRKHAEIISSHMGGSFEATWEAIHRKLQESGGGEVTQDGQELSVGDRIKGWFKDKIKAGWNWATGKFVGEVKSWVKNKLKGWLKKAIGAEFWWFALVDYGIDFLGDKLKGKLSVQRGPDEKKNSPDPHDNYYPYILDLQAILRTARDARSQVSNEVTDHISGYFKSIYDHDESASSSKTSAHTSVDIDAKAKSGSTSNVDVSHGSVDVQVQKGQSSQTGEQEHASTSRTYSGTTINIVAGEPVLSVIVQSKA